MFGILGGLFDPDGFTPRWVCGDWSTSLGWLHIGSDLAIWSAYTAIPLVIGYYALRRKDVPFVPLFWLFGAFIFACGTGHLIEAVIFWNPVYRLSGFVKLITAIVSWGTVIALIKVVPDAMRLPGLARLNTELETEIDERRRIQQEREHLLDSERAARADAERANRVKDDFLSIVSHELRTPLNAIQGYAHLLLVKQPEPAFVREAAEVIERNSRAQSQIIDDLLDTSRIMSGKVRLDMQPVDLAAVVEAAISSSRPAAKLREFEVPELAGLKVLVVDDEPDARKLVERLLSDYDVNVVLAGSVAEAEATFERERPDLVLSDIGMPEHDGYELIRRIRALPANSGGHTPAAAITAFARGDDRTRALLAGYQAHITKPVHAQELIAVVAALSGRTGR